MKRLIPIILMLIITSAPVYADELHPCLEAEFLVDYKEALSCFRLLGEQGDDKAQWWVGEYYYYGRGIPVHYKEAFKWYQFSAKQGNGNAQNKLGHFYSKGKIIKNILLAHMWFNLSASHPVSAYSESFDSMLRMHELELKMKPKQILKAQDLARNWKPKTWEEIKKTEK